MSSNARRVKDALWSMFEALWTFGFALAGRLARPKIERWSSTGGQRVWVIAPHPDDEVLGCAGAMLLHRLHGDEVCVIFVSDGRRSRAFGLEADDMAKRRKQEASASLAYLGIERFEWLGLPEGEWQVEQVVSQLARLAGTFAPDVVYAPSRVDFHPEHTQVAHTLARFLDDKSMDFDPLYTRVKRPEARIARGVVLRVYQVHVPLTSILTNLLADVSGVHEQALQARGAYTTQVDSVSRTRRMRRYASAYYHTGREVEEFWQMPARLYIEVHRDDPQRGPLHAFRGIRFRSLADPLAYVRGRAERQRLIGVMQAGMHEAVREA